MTGPAPISPAFTPAFTLAAMLSAVLLFLGVDLALHDSSAVVFKEGHAIETVSAVLLSAAAVLWWATGADDMKGRQWHVPVILVLMAMREMDFDKRFTSEGVLQLRLYSGASPLWEKAIGLAVIALILVCGWRLVRVTLPRWWAGLRAGRPASWLAGLAALMMAVAKTLDGLGRKLAALDVTISPELDRLSGRFEEILELAAYVMLVQALVYFLRDRPLIAAARRATVPAAAYRPRAC